MPHKKRGLRPPQNLLSKANTIYMVYRAVNDLRGYFYNKIRLILFYGFDSTSYQNKASNKLKNYLN